MKNIFALIPIFLTNVLYAQHQDCKSLTTAWFSKYGFGIDGRHEYRTLYYANCSMEEKFDALLHFDTRNEENPMRHQIGYLMYFARNVVDIDKRRYMVEAILKLIELYPGDRNNFYESLLQFSCDDFNEESIRMITERVTVHKKFDHALKLAVLCEAEGVAEPLHQHLSEIERKNKICFSRTVSLFKYAVATHFGYSEWSHKIIDNYITIKVPSERTSFFEYFALMKNEQGLEYLKKELFSDECVGSPDGVGCGGKVASHALYYITMIVENIPVPRPKEKLRNTKEDILKAREWFNTNPRIQFVGQ